MKKLITFVTTLLIAQLAISQIDTSLNYPRIAYPKEIVQDTCVQFTINQAKQAAIDGINADSYKEESDSLKSVVSDYQVFVNQKNFEIKQLNFDISVRNDIIDGYKLEKNKYKEWWEESEVKLHLTKKVDKIVYPVLGVTILTTILYIVVSSAIGR